MTDSNGGPYTLKNSAFEDFQREYNETLERQISLAFFRGFDGVDVYNIGLEMKFHPWFAGGEPTPHKHASEHHRYSFDGATYKDLRELVGDAGE